MTRKSRIARSGRAFMPILMIVPVAACAASPSASQAAPGTPAAGTLAAPLVDASGATIGEVRLGEAAGGVRLTVQARSLPPGVHGFHIHAVGKCEVPEFTTAGAHWNPGQHQHGHHNPQGAHAGDLPNLTVGADGTVAFDQVVSGIALKGGAAPMLDADGAAVVIHAAADDEKTDPSGNSGARIACATFSA